MSLSLTVFDICFWLMIALIALIAFGIESGVVARHRKVVVSSLLASTATVLLMLFHVDDNTSFITEHHSTKKDGGTKTISAAQIDTGADGTDLVVVGTADGSGGGQLPEVGAGGSNVAYRPRDCDDCPFEVLVDRGAFYIGSRLTEAGRGVDEGPRKEIKIPKVFSIAKFEVTRSDFEEFVAATKHESQADCLSGEVRRKKETEKLTWRNPGFLQGPRHPVVCVGYDDAKAYALWLSEKTGKKYRLPSQAQWEYVTRNGTITAYEFGDTLKPEQANYGSRKNGTEPVGSYMTDERRPADLHGNVWEITADCWSPDLSIVPEDGSNVGIAGDCTRHVLKGGGWDSEVERLRSAGRANLEDGKASPSVGFRLVRLH